MWLLGGQGQPATLTAPCGAPDSVYQATACLLSPPRGCLGPFALLMAIYWSGTGSMGGSQARWTHPRAERAGDRPASVPSHRVGFCFLWVSLHPRLEWPPPRAATAGPPLASGWLVESHLSQILTDRSGSQTRGTHHVLVRGKGELGVVVMRTESTLPGPSRRELSQEPGLPWKRPPALQAYSASLPVFCSSLNTRAHILTCTHTCVHMYVHTHIAHAHTNAYMCKHTVYMYTHACMHIAHVHTNAHLCKHTACMYTHTHKCTHILTTAYMYTCTQTCTHDSHAHNCTRMQTHTHTRWVQLLSISRSALAVIDRALFRILTTSCTTQGPSSPLFLPPQHTHTLCSQDHNPLPRAQRMQKSRVFRG